MKTLLVMLLCAAAMAQDLDPVHTQQLKDYLYQYGYLPATDLEKGVLRTERELEQAMLRLQKFMGLEMTGKLDGPTWDMLGEPRCGMPDMMVKDDGQDIVEVSHPANYRLHGTQWNKTVAYGFESYTSDLTQSRQTSIFDAAAGEWTAISQLQTTRVASADSADIKIAFFGTGAHNCSTPFAPDTLAHAAYPTGSDMHFNDAYTFTDDTNPYSLLFVAMHEFGHNFGIEHSSNREAVMYATYHRTTTFLLHEDDINAIRAIYGYKYGLNTEADSRWS